MITEAYRHIYGYRGTKIKDKIDPNRVYVCIYESKVIKKICQEAINNHEFKFIVNDYIEKLEKGLGENKPIHLGNCKLKSAGDVEIWSNVSDQSYGSGIKYAITLNILTDNFKGEKKVYKLYKDKYVKL